RLGGAAQRGQAFFGRSHHLEALVGGAGGENDGALAKGVAGLGHRLARGRCGESLDVHAASSPRIGPIRLGWGSGISLWASTWRRGAARRNRRAMALRMASGTSRQAGTPFSSCWLAMSDADLLSISATPGSSAPWAL